MILPRWCGRRSSRGTCRTATTWTAGRDGIHFNLRLEDGRLCCLVIVGVRADGTKGSDDSSAPFQIGNLYGSGKVVCRVSDGLEVFECACCEQPLTGGFVRLWPPTNIRVCYDCIDWMNSQRDLQVERAGGPVRVVGHEPVFRVIDIARAVEHYRRLGFRTEHHDETYAFAHLGNLTVHLAHDEHPEQHMTSVLYIHVEDADRLAADWRAAGATIDGPRNEDYGKREGRHVDPDGNLIRFGSPIPR